MKAYRIIKEKHITSAWTGYGAQTYGGRWNSIGKKAVYCASSVSLAMLEILVHVESDALLEAYRLLEIDIPDAVILQVDMQTLPENWREDPAPDETQQVGDEWLDSRMSMALSVPSTIVPQERNLILNPVFPGYEYTVNSSRLESTIEFDSRLK